VNIRRAQPQDAETLWQIYIQAVRTFARSHYTPAQIAAWEKLVTPQAYAKSYDGQLVYVAEDADGVLMGFAHLDMGTGSIEAVYVHPTYGRHGVGSRLLQALEEAACQAGLTELEMEASLNAVAFYTFNGFTAHEQRVHPVHGAEYACVYMTKVLGANAKRERLTANA